MKTSTALFFAPLLVLAIFAGLPCPAGISVESRLSLFTKGYNGSWQTEGEGAKNIIFDEVFFSLSSPFIKESSISAGYRFSHVEESQLFLSLLYPVKRMRVETGLTLGFLNDLPVELVPGVAAKAVVPVGRNIEFSMYGRSSLYMYPFFSLSPNRSPFDQNGLAFALTYRLKDAYTSIAYEQENLFSRSVGSTLKKNILQIFTMSVSTDLENFWINSTTELGGRIASIELGSDGERLVSLFVEETLYVTLKRAELFSGVEVTVLNVTMDDPSSVPLPKTPWIGFKAGVALRP